MKKLSLLVAMLAIAMIGMSQDIINYFEVSKNIAKPVTIKTSKGTFKIYGGERIDGNLSWLEAYDANGNKIVNNTPYKTDSGTNKPTIRYYRFSMLYNSSSTTPTKTPSPTNNNNRGTEIGKRIGQSLNDFASKGYYKQTKGYPNVQVRIGYSMDKYEFIGLHYEDGGMGGWYLQGAIGKTMTAIGTDEKLKWMAGIGWYGGNEHNTVDFGMFLGTGFTKGIEVFENSKNIKKVDLDPTKVTMGFELMYSHWFSFHPRLGLYLIVHGGLCLKTVPDLDYDLKMGIAYKISMDDNRAGKSKKHTSYPNLQLRTGWFSYNSEFVGLHWEGDEWGGYLSGSIGKDIFSDKYDEPNWMASVGFVMGSELSTVNFGFWGGNGFTTGLNLISMEKEQMDPYSFSFGMEFSYSYWFSFHPQLGLFIIGQGGFGTYAFPGIDLVGGIKMGLSYKIFHKHDN